MVKKSTLTDFQIHIDVRLMSDVATYYNLIRIFYLDRILYLEHGRHWEKTLIKIPGPSSLETDLSLNLE